MHIMLGYLCARISAGNLHVALHDSILPTSSRFGFLVSRHALPYVFPKTFAYVAYFKREHEFGRDYQTTYSDDLP